MQLQLELQLGLRLELHFAGMLGKWHLCRLLRVLLHACESAMEPMRTYGTTLQRLLLTSSAMQFCEDATLLYCGLRSRGLEAPRYGVVTWAC